MKDTVGEVKSSINSCMSLSHARRIQLFQKGEELISIHLTTFTLIPLTTVVRYGERVILHSELHVCDCHFSRLPAPDFACFDHGGY